MIDQQPDWPPQVSAIGLPNGTRRHGSTGQLWEAQDGRWIRVTWQPIETAPKDGTAIQAKIPGHGADNVIAWHGGLLNDAGDDCGGWHFMSDQEPPDDWTDGICWTKNEAGVPSTLPTEWKSLPTETDE